MRLLATIAIAVVLSACVRSYQRVAFDPNRACAAGDVRDCTCSTGAAGKQLCLADGAVAGCDCAVGATLTAPSSVAAGTTLGTVFLDLKDDAGRALTESTGRAATLTTMGTDVVVAGTGLVSNGRVTFTAAHIDAAGTYTLVAEYAGALGRPQATAPITVTSGAATKLVVKAEPPGVWEQGSPIAPPPEVQAQDAFGNPAPASGTVSVALDNPAFVLGPFAQASFAGSIATFSQLSVFSAQPAGNASLVFTSSGLTSVTSRSVAFASPDVEWPRFPIGAAMPSDLGSGVTLDRATGLLWRALPLAATGATGAIATCSGLAQTAVDGRMYAWRAPSLIETMTVVDHAASAPFVQAGIFTGFAADLYWTRTPVADDGTRAWAISFADGTSVRELATASHPVLCVLQTAPPRSPPANPNLAPALHYEDVGDGTVAVRDTKTRLVWQRAPIACASCTQAQAQAACDGEAALGETDWRLPTARELASIVNVRVTAGARVAPDAFPLTPAQPFWTSTPDPLLPTTHALVVDFSTGALVSRDRTLGASTSVRCVR